MTARGEHRMQTVSFPEHSIDWGNEVFKTIQHGGDCKCSSWYGYQKKKKSIFYKKLYTPRLVNSSDERACVVCPHDPICMVLLLWHNMLLTLFLYFRSFIHIYTLYLKN